MNYQDEEHPQVEQDEIQHERQAYQWITSQKPVQRNHTAVVSDESPHAETAMWYRDLLSRAQGQRVDGGDGFGHTCIGFDSEFL